MKTLTVGYIQNEYGLTRKQVDAAERATDRRFLAMKRSGKLTITHGSDLKKLLEKRRSAGLSKPK
jgi:hypothetical protein